MAVAVAPVAHPDGAALAPAPLAEERRIGWLFAGTGLLLFAVMGLLGLVMRLTQANVLDVSPSWFYRVMTLHGAGMLVGGLLAMMGALWFVVRPVAGLSVARMLWSFGLILGGAVAVVVAVAIGGFAAGWTFLSPLPFHSAGEWSTWAAVTFLGGMALVGTGFLVFCLDTLTAVTAAFGGLSRALGIEFLRGRDASPPPPQAIAAVVVSLEGALASVAGTTVVLALLGRAMDSTVELDALWAKNLTYFFGHSVANLIIYLAAGAIYVLVPRYAGRPWKTTKPIVVAWLATLVLVATAYSHHLYMDFVQPRFAQYVSLIASSTAAIPVAVVTIYTGVMLVWGSRYRWTLASTLLYLGFAGWAIGGTGAVLDSLIPLNFFLHNTLWVPAHFHTYLMLGVMFWVMAFVAHLLERAADRPASRLATVGAPAAMVVGGYGLVGSWYASGALGVPRRWAVHPAGTEGYSVVGSVGVLIFAAGFAVLLAEFASLAAAGRRRGAELAPAAPAARPAPPSGLTPPIAGPNQAGIVAAAATIALTSLFPPVLWGAEVNARYHHLDHTAQFLLGALVGLAVGCARAHARGIGVRPSGPAMAAVVVAPAAMLLAMVPGIYEGLEDHDGLHFLYHLGVVALGLVTGLGAARLGRTTGRLVLLLSVGMGAMYAAGVTGG